MSKRFETGIIILLSVIAVPLACVYISDFISAPPDSTAGIEQAPAMEGYTSIYHPAHIDSTEAWSLMNSNEGALILDVRSEASYLENHVSAAINVPFETVADYAAANIPDKDRTIICYCFCDDKGGSALSAYNLLTDLGYTNVFYMEPGSEWTYEGTSAAESSEDHSGVNIISGARAKEIYDSNDAVILLDVRNQDEYDAGYIDGSILIPAAELEARLPELPGKNAIIIVYCKSGTRSADAHDILSSHDYTNVYDMQRVDNWPEPLVTK